MANRPLSGQETSSLYRQGDARSLWTGPENRSQSSVHLQTGQATIARNTLLHLAQSTTPFVAGWGRSCTYPGQTSLHQHRLGHRTKSAQALGNQGRSGKCMPALWGYWGPLVRTPSKQTVEKETDQERMGPRGKIGDDAADKVVMPALPFGPPSSQLTPMTSDELCWKAGCRVEWPAQFGGGWAETCVSDDVTRRPSTLFDSS